MEDASGLIYTMRDLNQNTARVMNEIREAGKPAFITSYGRFVAVITPLEPGQVEQQALAAIAREMAAEGLAAADLDEN
jgi:antitoxin (DNA-binding transcriptional repressor) of toxin-antitoxin stability system